MTSASTVPLCFLIPRGPPPRKRPDVGGKKEKVCLLYKLAMLCGVFFPSKIPLKTLRTTLFSLIMSNGIKNDFLKLYLFC